ncbi:PREDICTED: ethylene-responsive transcription factor ERF025-like [Camelina sativa]|uniref:Ethylene-responsive transcription factor ERF025-like n=1 Tax=Camelina sativa TaxID=90675 RepID=A0ABM0UL18_CAMSA|nr:PREDICTED: ethylene-responsive transcription factor ERF025-like [Camelina sativa]
MSNTKSPTTGNQETTTSSREVSIALPSKPSDHSPQSSPSSSSSPRPSTLASAGGSPARRTGTGLSGKHSFFRGIRLRNGKWVSEIREPRKTTRIWLGTYPVPEMAAAAYDVAALALKGSDAVLNFPGLALTYVPPVSNSAADIRAAASKAAEMKQPDPGEAEKVLDPTGQPGKEEEVVVEGEEGFEFMDEEEMLNMPTLLTEMAEGMLMSPPRMMITPTVDDDSPENHHGDNLWSYK